MAELINVGLDYLRATSCEDGQIEQMFEASRFIMAVEEENGYTFKPGGQLGFYGRRTRHCFFGKREEWAMLQVTGKECRKHNNLLLNNCAHVTRIDLQITVRVEPGQSSNTIMDAKMASIEKKPANGKKWKTKSRDTDNRIETVYIGSRESEWYGRIYDKYEESKSQEYKDCVRYEVEIKGEAAQRVWIQLRSKGNQAMMVRIVQEWFKMHGVAIDVPDLNGVSYEKPQKEQHRDDKKLAWLARMVSGTVQHLCSTGHWYPAFEALFSKALTSDVRYGILLSMAIVEAS